MKKTSAIGREFGYFWAMNGSLLFLLFIGLVGIVAVQTLRQYEAPCRLFEVAGDIIFLTCSSFFTGVLLYHFTKNRADQVAKSEVFPVVAMHLRFIIELEAETHRRILEMCLTRNGPFPLSQAALLIQEKRAYFTSDPGTVPRLSEVFKSIHSSMATNALRVQVLAQYLVPRVLLPVHDLLASKGMKWLERGLLQDVLDSEPDEVGVVLSTLGDHVSDLIVFHENHILKYDPDGPIVSSKEYVRRISHLGHAEVSQRSEG